MCISLKDCVYMCNAWANYYSRYYSMKKVLAYYANYYTNSSYYSSYYSTLNYYIKQGTTQPCSQARTLKYKKTKTEQT
jgi:hypothetical protein